jgi:hypothetical protein
MKDIRCLLGFHGEIVREFHVKKKDYMEFNRVDVNEKCIRCGNNNFLKDVKESKIVVRVNEVWEVYDIFALRINGKYKPEKNGLYAVKTNKSE